jgi:hypothetical protein
MVNPVLVMSLVCPLIRLIYERPRATLRRVVDILLPPTAG